MSVQPNPAEWSEPLPRDLAGQLIDPAEKTRLDGIRARIAELEKIMASDS